MTWTPPKTKYELMLTSELRRQGIEFRHNPRIGAFYPDIVIDSIKLIIEIDGAYHDDPKQKAFDEARASVLNRIGYTVVRYSNGYVQSKQGISEIISTLRERLGMPSKKDLLKAARKSRRKQKKQSSKLW